jgi:hypothetical protein
MKKKIEYYAISNSEGRHSFVVAHDGDLEKTISKIVQGLKEDMCVDKIEFVGIFRLPKDGISKNVTFNYFEDGDEEGNEDYFEIVITTVYGDTTKEDIESILFQYAESNGLLSSKGDIEDFNEWVKENLE